MKLRDLAESKRDMLMIDPRIIKVEPGYNIRDLSAPSAREKLLELAQSIAAIGVQQPLTVRLKDGEVFVVAGHRRRAATMLAIETLGKEIAAIPCIPEPKGTSEADRCADLVVSNSGEPLTPLEVASVVKRLLGFGWEPDDIAKRLGWSSRQTVDNHMVLLSAPQSVQDMVRKGEVSASTAVSVTRKHGGDAEVTLAKAKRKAEGEGKTRVTQAHVSSATGEFQATAGNVKTMMKALQAIADMVDEEASEIAIAALESIGVFKRMAA